MNKYPKIQTVFKRDPATNYKTLLRGDYSLPEFEYLKDAEWVFTEKVDGTNIRVLFQEGDLSFRGRTDKATIPTFLLETLVSMFDVKKMSRLFRGDVCLYGEGYGDRIQKAGDLYNPDGNGFALFDVRIGRYWLRRYDVETIASELGVEIVPVIGRGTLSDMVKMVENKSLLSSWGDFPAEGIVARPREELLSRNGERIITKLKARDF